MKWTFLILSLICLIACKTDKTELPKKSKIDIVNSTKITPELVDSLKKNRRDKLTDLRKNVGYHCGTNITDAFLYFKVKVDSNGKYSDIEVTEKEGLDHVTVQACIEKYLAENELDLGIIREMPDSKYGAIPRVKSYTLRVF